MTVRHISEWDFGVIGLTLQAIFDEFLAPEQKDRRQHYMEEAERTWYSRSIADREEWYRKVQATQLALNELRVKKDPRLLVVIDELFQGPQCWSSQLATAGDLMAEAHNAWKHLGDLNEPSDSQVVAVVEQRFAVNELSAVRLLYDYRWTEAGFPLVKISPKFVAAAMCTKLESDVLSDLRGPWKAFDVELPVEAVLYQWSSVKQPVQVAHIQVLYGENPVEEDRRWCITLKSAPEGEVTRRIWMLNTELCAEEEVGEDWTLPWMDRSGFDQRALMLAGRIVASVVCALTNAKMVVQVDRRVHETWEKRSVSSRDRVLVPRTYQLVPPITVDLIKEVRHYQLHKSSKRAWKLLVQRTVCGHWKMQVCGVGRVDRKRMWIQPYKRGPRTAPVAVSPHVIKDGESRASRSTPE